MRRAGTLSSRLGHRQLSCSPADRCSNPRVRHQLAQIADGSIKLPVRTLPTLRAERSAGRVPTGCATTIAAWVLHLRGAGRPSQGPRSCRRSKGSQQR